MSNLCVIPARGGSKRILKKNIRLFNGKPIISYVIETAIKSGLFDEIMVSSDNMEVLEIAKKYGASTPFLRSIKNSDDFATTIDVMKEVIDDYQMKDVNFTNYCCIYPTAVLITPVYLKKGFDKLIIKSLDAVLSIVKYSFPIEKAFVIDDMNNIECLNPAAYMKRSQDLNHAYHDAGQFYWFSSRARNLDNLLINQKIGYIEIDELETQDINTESDWKLAELKYKLLHH